MEKDTIIVVDKKSKEKRKNILVAIGAGLVSAGLVVLGYKAGTQDACNRISLGMSEVFKVKPELEQQMWDAIGELKSNK